MVLLVNAAIGALQLIVAIVLAVAALYIGFSVLGILFKGLELQRELTRGNSAVGIIVAAVFFAIALVVQSGVSGIANGLQFALTAGIFSLDGLLAITSAVIQLLLGIVLAITGIFIALRVLDRLTKGIEEFEEIRKGNIAVALEMAGVIVAVAVIIQSGVMGITSVLV